jgi:predicted Rossmann-fold nucleotide-binding protein
MSWTWTHRKPQVCVLGSAEPGSRAYELAAEAGEELARLGVTLISGCGSSATRVAAERAIHANGLVLSIVPPDEMPPAIVLLAAMRIAAVSDRSDDGKQLGSSELLR